MKYYVPYTKRFDHHTKTYCLTGGCLTGDIEKHGRFRRYEPFGVGSGSTLTIAEENLRQYLLESIAHTDDFDFSCLRTTAPEYNYYVEIEIN